MTDLCINSIATQLAHQKVSTQAGCAQRILTMLYL